MASSVSSYFYYCTSPPSFSSSSSRPLSLSSNPNNLSSLPSHFRYLSFQPKKGIRVPNSPPCLRVLCLREPKGLLLQLVVILLLYVEVSKEFFVGWPNGNTAIWKVKIMVAVDNQIMEQEAEVED